MIERFSVDLGSRAVFFPPDHYTEMFSVWHSHHMSSLCGVFGSARLYRQLNPWIRFLILYLVEGLTLRRENISVSNAGQSRVPCGFQYANGAIPVKYPMNFPWICAWISLFLMANILLQWWVKTWHPGTQASSGAFLQRRSTLPGGADGADQHFGREFLRIDMDRHMVNNGQW